MRRPLVAANWKMYKTVHEAVAFVERVRAASSRTSTTWTSWLRRRSRRCAAAAERRARQPTSAIAGQDLYWEREGAFTGEVSAPMLREAGAAMRHRRPLRAPHDVRRDRRGREPQGRAPRSRAGSMPIVCVGETLDEREAERDDGGARPAVKDGARGPAGREQVGARWWSPTSRCGRSAPAGTRPPRRRRRRTRTSARRLREWFGAEAAETVPDPLRRQRQARQHAGTDAPGRTWTARWWAARASTSAASSKSWRRAGPAGIIGSSGHRAAGVCWQGIDAGLHARAPPRLGSARVPDYLLDGVRGGLPGAAAGHPAPAGQGRRHRQRVRRQQQPDGVRRPAGATLLTRSRRWRRCCSCSARSAWASSGSAAAGRRWSAARALRRARRPSRPRRRHEVGQPFRAAVCGNFSAVAVDRVPGQASGRPRRSQGKAGLAG